MVALRCNQNCTKIILVDLGIMFCGLDRGMLTTFLFSSFLMWKHVLAVLSYLQCGCCIYYKYMIELN